MGHIPVKKHLKYRNCFIHSVKPANFHPKVIRCSEYLRRTDEIPHRIPVNLDESLASGHVIPWTTWRCLFRLRKAYTCSKEQQTKWQYFDGDTTCGLVAENTARMLQCTFLALPCTLDNLSMFNDTAKSCVER